MSYPAGNIIPINVRISPTGLATANFASAMLFAPNAELPEGFEPDTYREYFSLKSLSSDFAATTETYKSAQRWLGGTPATRSLRVWAIKDKDFPVASLTKARDTTWWYWTFFTAPDLVSETSVYNIAEWCEDNASMFVNNQTGDTAGFIRSPSSMTNIAIELTKRGYRHVFTATHATDGNAGNALAKHFAAVNYSATRSTITGELEKSPGVIAENLTDTASATMQKDTVKAVFYSVVDLQGSSDMGRWLNTTTHSTYGEFIDDVVNLDAMINTLTVALYNILGGQVTKLPQTPVGQAMLIGGARAVGEQYIRNGYLGPRNYTDPDDGLNKHTVGYEILTKPEDILDISEADRNARKSAALRIRLFRAGAIHQAPVDVDVY